MLRLALIENLRRVARARRRRPPRARPRRRLGRADDRGRRAGSEEPGPGRSPTWRARTRRWRSAFVAELARRLQGQGAALALAADLDRAAARRSPARRSSSWCRRRASSRRPTRSRSATASAACASSARWTGASSSRRMSVVERTLREDPAGVYAAMDFATRDRYRHVVEPIARRSPPGRGRGRAQGDRARAPGARRRAGGDATRRRTSATTWSTSGLPQLEHAARVAPAGRATAAPAAAGACRSCSTSAPIAADHGDLQRRAAAAGHAGAGRAALAVLVLPAWCWRRWRRASSRSRSSTGWRRCWPTPRPLPRMDFSARHSRRVRARWSWCRPC